MNSIASNLTNLQKNIHQAEKEFSRTANSVKLIAVSKKQSVEKIREAYSAGQKDFAENYLQEALEKIKLLDELEITWHFIGAIQSNKCKQIASYFDWVHSVDRFEVAKRLSNLRHPDAPALNICLQVNLDDETSKSGIDLSELRELAQRIQTLPQLKLRGLMCIPKHREDFSEQRAVFHHLREAFDQLNSQGFSLDTLSMGMSDDFVAAIAEGSTMIRIGTAIFGARTT